MTWNHARLKQAAKVAIATGAAFCVGLIGNHLLGESTQGDSDRTPFTATVLKIWYNPDGTEIMRDTVVHGVKSDGSRAISTVRHVQSIRGAPPESFENREIWDVGAKMRYELVPMVESVSSYPLSDQRVRGLRAVPSDCSRRVGDWKFDATPQPPTILGYRVVKRSTGSPAASAEEDPVIFEEWVAPELGCLALRSRVRNVGGASGEGVTRGSTEAVRITPGEPDAELFRVPAKYTERSPQETQEEIARLRGVPFEMSPPVEVRTNEYYQSRAGGAK